MADRRPRTPRPGRVARTERLSASMVRVVVTLDQADGFEPVHADSYVKVVFADPGAEPQQRTYTVRRWDATSRELTLDFVVHGDAGLAGPWALRAQPGDEVLIQGPGGGYTPDPDAAFHLLAGDESALPAIAAALEAMPAGATGAAFVEVHAAADELPLSAPPGITITWLHRGDEAPGSRLVEAVTAWQSPAGEGHWFVHGEAAMVRDLRRHLRTERGVPLARLSISGYWRLGVDDEGWRAVKRDWNRAVEQSEAALVT